MGAVFGTPADVVKTRFMNQPLDKTGRYALKLLFALYHILKQALVIAEVYCTNRLLIV